MRITKDQKAITLIALVITIIVLLILAGVALATLTGNKSIIENANNAVERYNASAGNDQNVLNQVENLFAKYMGGSSSTGDDDDTPQTPTQKTAASLQEGEWVMYDTGVSGIGVIPCRVLYNDATHGIQLISKGTVGDNITLGDPNENFNTALASYNSAIETLNTAAMTYKNSTYANDARSVGSVPTVENGMFTSKNSETAAPFTMEFQYNNLNQINVKGADENYTTDWTKMGSLGTANENIQSASAAYWLASRDVYSNSDGCDFNVRYVDSGGNLNYGNLCYVGSSDDADGYSDAYGLRPCISLKSDIKVITEGGKDGTTEATAYTLGI